jgi:hypothetical protein
MGDRFRQLIDAELAEEVPPPLGDVLRTAMRDGRRMRRARALRAGLACVAAVGVLALGLGVAAATGVPAGGGGTQVGAAGDAGTSSPVTVPTPSPTATPPPSPSVTVGTRPVPTIGLDVAAPEVAGKPGSAALAGPSAVLVLLLDLLPAGRTSDHAGGAYADFTGVQVYLNRGAGYGMIRLAVAGFLPRAAAPCRAGDAAIRVSCRDVGGVVVETFEIEANCVQRRGVNVFRPDGFAIQINISDCLARRGAGVPVVEEVLSTDEAIAIALDPTWSPANLNYATRVGAERYPALPLLPDFAGVGG